MKFWAHRKAWWTPGFAASIFIFAATGCGIPLSNQPTNIQVQGSPPTIAKQSPSTSSSTTTSIPSVEVPITIYLVDLYGHLYPVQRYVPISATLAEVVSALADGPTASESAFGIQSEVPADTRVESTTVSSNGTVVTIDFNSSFAQTAGISTIEAAAQVVITTLQFLPKATGVSFEINGTLVGPTVQGGQQVPIANRADYSSFLPPAISQSG